MFLFLDDIVIQAMNKYGVEFSGPGGVPSRLKLSGPKLLCQMKEKVEVLTLTPDLHPFALLPWASQLPQLQLTSELGPYKSCAVVSSAGSLRNSGLGKEIGETNTFSPRPIKPSVNVVPMSLQSQSPTLILL